MSRILANIPNTDAPNNTYPSGKIRNKDTNANPPIAGSPITEELYGDIIQFFQKLLRRANITPNDNPDNENNGFQLVDALDAALDAALGTLGNAATKNVGTTLGTVCAGDDSRLIHLVDRGDNGQPEFDNIGQHDNLPITGEWTELDLTNYVDSGAKFVILRVVASILESANIRFRTNGNAYEANTAGYGNPWITGTGENYILYSADLTVALDANKCIEYVVSDLDARVTIAIAGFYTKNTDWVPIQG